MEAAMSSMQSLQSQSKLRRQLLDSENDASQYQEEIQYEINARANSLAAGLAQIPSLPLMMYANAPQGNRPAFSNMNINVNYNGNMNLNNMNMNMNYNNHNNNNINNNINVNNMGYGPQKQQIVYPGIGDLDSPYGPVSSQSMDSMASSGPSKKASSMTLNSAISLRLFRRNKSGNLPNFDDEKGVDIGDLSQQNVSMQDLRHLRGTGGPYAMLGGLIDTTPIIPTIGAVNPMALAKNNQDYRKQMNHKKKLAYLAGARANSLQAGSDPRSMSMRADPRAMSMRTDPRAMSMRTDPRAMSMMGGNSFNGNQPRGDPRTMSMMGGGYARSQTMMQFPQNQQQQYQQYQQYNQMHNGWGRGPPNGPPNGPNGPPNGPNGPNGPPNGRAMSMNTHGPPGVNPQYYYQNGYQNMGNMPNGMAYPNGMQNMPNGVPNGVQNMPNGMPNGVPSVPNGPNGSPNIPAPHTSVSNDSLSKVVEEEEEPKTLRPNFDDDDIVYKFGAEEMSRKSTLKKKDSMRLRKINFNGADDEDQGTSESKSIVSSMLKFNHSEDPEANNNTDANATNGTEASRMSYIDTLSQFSKGDNSEKLKQIGANAETSPTKKDVFYSALDFTSPAKLNGLASGAGASASPTSVYEDEPSSLLDPGLTRSDTKSTLKSLVANTAFSKFRLTSTDSSNRAPSYSSPFLQKSTQMNGNGPVNDSSDITSIGSKASKNLTRKQPLDMDLDLDDEKPPLPPKDDRYSPRPSLDSQDTTFVKTTLTRKAPPGSIPATPMELGSESTKKQEEVYPDHPNTSNGSINVNQLYLTGSSSVLNFGSGKIIREEPDEGEKSSNKALGSTLLDAFGISYDSPDAPESSRGTTFSDNIIPSDSLSVLHEPENKKAMLQSGQNDSTSNINVIIPSHSINNYNTYGSDVVKTPIMEHQAVHTGSATPNASIVSSSATATPTTAKDERKASRSFSLKSRSLFKKVTGKRLSVSEDNFEMNLKSPKSPSRRKFLGASINEKEKEKKFTLTTAELAIMNCNSDLLNELELVTTELASSVKRELLLENQVYGTHEVKTKHHMSVSGLDSKYAQTLADLQERLNKERRMRFISEEHALLWENGVNPSPLKLEYEKNEMYRQLLLKNDETNQLKDRIAELENERDEKKSSLADEKILDHYNELLKENSELKFKVIPELEKSIANISISANSGPDSLSRQFHLGNINNDTSLVYSNELLEIQSLKQQRDELGDAITHMKNQHEIELKQAKDKVKNIQQKLSDANNLNERLLSRDRDRDRGRDETETQPNALPNPGGRLQGLNVVTSTNKLFD